MMCHGTIMRHRSFFAKRFVIHLADILTFQASVRVVKIDEVRQSTYLHKTRQAKMQMLSVCLQYVT